MTSLQKVEVKGYDSSTYGFFLVKMRFDVCDFVCLMHRHDTQLLMVSRYCVVRKFQPTKDMVMHLVSMKHFLKLFEYF